MNVQITPLQTPPSRGDDRDDAPAGRGRTYLIGGAALVLALGGWWYFTHSSGPAPRRIAAAPVKVAPVDVSNMAVIERTIGTVLANSTVQVTARVQGQLMAALFKEGDMVKKGDLLFQIDPRPYEAALTLAQGQMARDQAQFEGYDREAKRLVSLFAQNAISASARDQATGLAKQLAAAVSADKGNVEMARLNLEYTSIRSPVNGKTGPILVQPGNLVTASSSVAASSLVTINEILPVKISLSLPQSDLPRIQEMQRTKGLTLTIALHDAGGPQDIEVPVNFISNAVTGNTGTIELRASSPNTDMALVPGQLVDVVVALSEIPHATVVPREAINTGPDGQFVYAVKDGTAQQVPVRVLFDDGVNDAVSGNLKKGDQVIIDGQLRVIPGAKVSVTGAKKNAAGGKDQLTSGRRRVPHAQDTQG